MAKGKCKVMVTPNTLETMIEYTLISNILDKIWKMIKNTFWISKRFHLAKTPQAIARNQNMSQVENPPFCNYIFNYCLITNIVENLKNNCKLFFAIGKCFSQLQTTKVDKYKSKVSLQLKVFATCQYHINSHYLPFKLQNVLPI
jgi:hypothetical protein